MTYKTKIALLFIIGCISFCILSLSYNIFAETAEEEYLIRGFSGSFYLIKNNNNTASCTSIKSNGESTEVFHQTNANIIKAVTSKSYLYLLVEDNSNQDSFISVFTLLRNGSITSVYAVETDAIAFTFTADDSYFYFLSSNKNTVIKVNQSRITSDKITLQTNIRNLFNYSENIYALSDNSVINLNDTSRLISSDMPYFSASGVFKFYNNICIDDNGKAYLFDQINGFKYIKSISYEKSFIIDSTYCGVSRNIIYSLSENGSKVGKFTCYSDIYDVCVSENKAAVLYYGGMRIISLKDFTSIKNENSYSEESSYPDKISEYKIVDGYMLVPKGTTIAEVKKHINISDGVALVFYDENGKTVTSGKVGTGFSVAYYKNAYLQRKHTIIIEGDLTGEGSVNTRDSKALTDYLLEKNDLSEAQKFAADLNKDGKTDAIDLLLLIRKL